jgi:hypothetical protein
MEQEKSTVESVYSPEARAAERGQLASDIEAFLNNGGEVTQVARGERADPPKKPENNYGRGSI